MPYPGNADGRGYILLPRANEDPDPLLNNGKLYSKIEGGVTQLYYQNDAGAVVQLTPVGGGGGSAMSQVTGSTEEELDTINTEQRVGGFAFDPSLVGDASVTFRAVSLFNTADVSGSLEIRLYDMGPGTGAFFAPELRASLVVAYANVGKSYITNQLLSAVFAPGINMNEIHNTMRVYELRAYLNTSDVAALGLISWGGLLVI